MRPKSYGSSTIGMKKSVVAMTQVLSLSLPDRGVVGGLGADQQLLVERRGRLVGQQLLQDGRGELAAAAAAVGEAGEAESMGIHARERTGCKRLAPARV